MDQIDSKNHRVFQEQWYSGQSTINFCQPIRKMTTSQVAKRLMEEIARKSKRTGRAEKPLK